MSNTENRKLRKRIRRLETELAKQGELLHSHELLKAFFNDKKTEIDRRFWDNSSTVGLINILMNLYLDSMSSTSDVRRIQNHVNYYLDKTLHETVDREKLDIKSTEVREWVLNDYSINGTPHALTIRSNSQSKVFEKIMSEMNLPYAPRGSALGSFMENIIALGVANGNITNELERKTTLRSLVTPQCDITLSTPSDVLNVLQNNLFFYRPFESENVWSIRRNDIYELFNSLTVETQNLNVISFFVYNIWCYQSPDAKGFYSDITFRLTTVDK